MFFLVSEVWGEWIPDLLREVSFIFFWEHFWGIWGVWYLKPILRYFFIYKKKPPWFKIKLIMSHLGPLKCQESSDRVCSTPHILELGAIHLSVLLPVDHSGAAVRAASAEGPRCPRAPRPAAALPCRCRLCRRAAGGAVRHVGCAPCWVTSEGRRRRVGGGRTPEDCLFSMLFIHLYCVSSSHCPRMVFRGPRYFKFFIVMDQTPRW